MGRARAAFAAAVDGVVLASGVAPGPTLRLAESHSCSPGRTCAEIGSCEEAMWLLDTCAWGGKLDRDKDGVPCESLC